MTELLDVLWTEQAREDVRSVADHLEAQRELLGLRFLAAAAYTVDLARFNPWAPLVSNVEGVRRLLFADPFAHSHALYFRLEPPRGELERIVILAIFDVRRNPGHVRGVLSTRARGRK